MFKPVAMAVAALFGLPVSSAAQSPSLYPHAQQLVEQVIAANPDMLDVLMHVTPPDSMKNIVIAAHLAKANGEASGEDDLGVMSSGKPIVEVQKDGVRIGVLVQMQDKHHRSIGALGLMYPYRPGDDQAVVLKRSFKIRDRIAQLIPSRASLFS